jgi:hypothetical protein
MLGRRTKRCQAALAERAVSRCRTEAARAGRPPLRVVFERLRSSRRGGGGSPTARFRSPLGLTVGPRESDPVHGFEHRVAGQSWYECCTLQRAVDGLDGTTVTGNVRTFEKLRTFEGRAAGAPTKLTPRPPILYRCFHLPQFLPEQCLPEGLPEMRFSTKEHVAR